MATDERSLITTLHITYALHAVGLAIGAFGAASVVGMFIFGWPSIIAVIVNYVKRDEVRGTYLDSHFSWQLRTFWYALLWVIVIGLLFMTLIGIPIALIVAMVVGIWVIYRIIRGWLALIDARPVRHYAAREV